MQKRRPVCILMSVICCLLFLTSAAMAADSASSPRLLKVVALTRAGVSAPQQSEAMLDSWTERTWPKWPASRGELTRRGAALVSELWSELRNRYLALGVLPANASPAAVYVRADNRQPARATASALLDSILPQGNNGYAINSLSPDPLFHPVQNGMCVFHFAATAKDVLNNMEDGLPGLNAEYAQQLSLLDSIVGSADTELCTRYALPPGCRLSSIPSSVAIARQGTSAFIQGGLGIASSLTDVFLREFSQWPSEPAAWGQADTATMRQILSLHSTVFNAVQRTPSVAGAQGSTLLNELLAALQGKMTDSRANRSPIVIFVGSDVNIANVAALLDIHWQASGYPGDIIPPAAALAFELWQEGESKVVRITFFAHALETLHSSTPFEDEESLAAFTVRVGKNESSPLPLDNFYARARAAIRKDCIFTGLALPQLVPAASEGALEKSLPASADDAENDEDDPQGQPPRK